MNSASDAAPLELTAIAVAGSVPNPAPAASATADTLKDALPAKAEAEVDGVLEDALAAFSQQNDPLFVPVLRLLVGGLRACCSLERQPPLKQAAALLLFRIWWLYWPIASLAIQAKPLLDMTFQACATRAFPASFTPLLVLLWLSWGCGVLYLLGAVLFLRALGVGWLGSLTATGLSDVVPKVMAFMGETGRPWLRALLITKAFGHGLISAVGFFLVGFAVQRVGRLTVASLVVGVLVISFGFTNQVMLICIRLRGGSIQRATKSRKYQAVHVPLCLVMALAVVAAPISLVSRFPSADCGTCSLAVAGGQIGLAVDCLSGSRGLVTFYSGAVTKWDAFDTGSPGFWDAGWPLGTPRDSGAYVNKWGLQPFGCGNVTVRVGAGLVLDGRGLGVVVFGPTGKLLRRIALPELPVAVNGTPALIVAGPYEGHTLSVTFVDTTSEDCDVGN